MENVATTTMKLPSKAKSFILKCKRVWHVLRKPTRKEFEQVAKISAIGIMVLGLLGFLVSIIMKLFSG
jgi:protein transport protein SEC61 subunit gamma-like protein